MKYLIIAFMSINLSYAAHWNGKIIDLKSNQIISHSTYIRHLSHYSHIILGEKHYSHEVQKVQANTIQDVVLLSGKTGAFTTGWEFLNVTSQSQTDSLFAQLKNQEITADKFLLETQGKTPTQTYAPILNVTAELGGNLLGLNLSRAEKSPVTERGIEALDPKLLPPGFAYGTTGYYERFVEAMQGHATPEQVKNFYASQCLVDDVMAYYLLKRSENELNFVIAGSFHTDFYDGVVNRLKLRDSGISIVTVKIIDASDYSVSELEELLHDEKYGDVADYVYFVNEPSL